MKKIYALLIAFVLITSCENSTEKDKRESTNKTFKSVNVKTEGKQYFTFATNSGTLTESANYDIAFGVTPLTVENSPCQFFIMPTDPIIFVKNGLEIARVEAENLDAVTEIPEKFNTDNLQPKALIGKNWFDAQYKVKPDVYVLKNCGKNYGILSVKRYEMDFAKHQISNIVLEYKYNSTGSPDFTSATLDSFITANTYEKTKYYSFENGEVKATDTYDFKVEKGAIWLGNKASALKMENTQIDAITAATTTGLETDLTPSITTLGWYRYGEGHVLTPKNYVYVVKTDDGKYPAFEIVNYYNDRGESGTFTIEWKYLK